MSKELKISCIPYRGWSCKYSELNQLTNEEQSLMWQAFNKYKLVFLLNSTLLFKMMNMKLLSTGKKLRLIVFSLLN